MLNYKGINKWQNTENKEIDIKTKREAAIEELLMFGNSIKAKAYQDAIK